MTAPRTFPREAAAALFLARQWLDRPRGRALAAGSLAAFAESVGGLQIDSINVLDRAHYLTAWSRFGEFPRAELDRLIYDERVLLEYWAHAACFVPRADVAAWRRTMVDYRRQHTGWSSWLRKNGRMLREVEAAIAERGPLGNADFREPRPGGGGAGWWSWKPATHALHFLWMSGRILVRERRHFQKQFDLAERVLPEIAAFEPLPWPEFIRWHVRRSLRAMGAATELDLRQYLSYPRLPVAKRRAALKALLKSGEVLPVAIEHQRTPWYALAEDLPALERAAAETVPAAGTTLLAPFDSLLWHRERVRALFGFDYRIEVYTPGHKRVHGYYSLPLFHDGQLLGRVDAKLHRAERRLEVRHTHFEPWFARGKQPPAARWAAVDRAAAIAGCVDAIGSLARFEVADHVAFGRVSPASLAGEIAVAARAAGLAAAATGAARTRATGTAKRAASRDGATPTTRASRARETSRTSARRAVRRSR